MLLALSLEQTKMTERNLIPQKPEVKMSSRELTGCNKRPSDRVGSELVSWWFFPGFSGDDLETEARRIGEIKEARFGKPRCQSGIYLSIHVPPDFQCVFPFDPGTWRNPLRMSKRSCKKRRSGMKSFKKMPKMELRSLVDPMKLMKRPKFVGAVWSQSWLKGRHFAEEWMKL